MENNTHKIKPPTHIELMQMMSNLSSQMIHVAVCMDYYGGFDNIMTNHATELSNAGRMIETWVMDLEESELGNE